MIYIDLGGMGMEMGLFMGEQAVREGMERLALFFFGEAVER